MNILFPKQTTDRFKRCLVFSNPASTNAALTRQRIDALRSAMPGCEIVTIQTLPDGYQANRTLLEKHAAALGKESLLCIAGGDGTTNQIIEAIIMSEALTPEQRATPILPLWCGNGNDLAHMLNGSNRTRLDHIIADGEVLAIHPLQCDMKREDGVTITRIAASYAGFGATAFAALKMNTPAHRQSKLHALPGGRPLQDVLTVASALLEAPKFAVKDADAVQLVYERTFANGSRMAKLMRLPVELTDEMFFLDTLEDRKLVSALPHFVDLLLKRVSGKLLKNHVHFTVQEPSWAHFDGEPQEVPARTDVDVQLSPQPFYALSTALGKRKKNWASVSSQRPGVFGNIDQRP